MVKLADIARTAGCSVAVASRALSRDVSQSRTVAKATAARVVEIARQAGYQSRHERSRHRAAGVIGVFVPENHSSLMLELLTAIATAANAADTPLHIYSDADRESFRHFVRNYGETNRNLGIIAYYPPDPHDVAGFMDMVDALERRDGRIVLIHNNAPAELPLVSIRIDNYHGGKLAGEYLVQHGCKNCFGMVSGDNCYRNERTRGFLEAMGQAGISATLFQSSNIDFGGPAILAMLHNFIRLIDWEQTEPAGIFCDGDWLAARLLHEIIRHGLTEKKRTLRIIGYDDEFFLRVLYPEVATIRQPFREMGRLAIVKLINMLKGLPEKSELLKPELIVRKTMQDT